MRPQRCGENIPYSKIAEELDYTRVHITNVFNGMTQCSKKLAQLIEEHYGIPWVSMIKLFDQTQEGQQNSLGE